MATARSLRTSGDPGAVTVSPGSLTFKPENWEKEQLSFNIIPVRDDDTNDESVTLTLSSDGLTSKTVTVEVRDDDPQRIVSKAIVQVDESGPGDLLVVTLSAKPNGDRTVTAVSDDTGAVTVSPGLLTFTPANWNEEQVFDIIRVQDDDTNDESVTLTLSGDGLASKTVTVEVTDDDTQGIESKDTVQVGESHEAVLGVTLSARPNGDRTVTAVSDDTGAVTVSPGSLTFKPENWEKEQLSFHHHPGPGRRHERRERDADAEQRRADQQDGHGGGDGRRHATTRRRHATTRRRHATTRRRPGAGAGDPAARATAPGGGPAPTGRDAAVAPRRGWHMMRELALEFLRLRFAGLSELFTVYLRNISISSLDLDRF